MDVIGSLGYHGQEVFFIDTSLVAYITGKSICVVDITVGPREMIWRHETGIKNIASNQATNLLVVLPGLPGFKVEVLKFSGQSQTIYAYLTNPTETVLVHAAFCRSGDRLCALSDVLDRQFVLWDIESQTVMLSSKLELNYQLCSFNPANQEQILFRGDDGLCIGVVSEIVGYYSLKRHRVAIDVENGNTALDTEFDIEKQTGKTYLKPDIKFALWAPINRLYIGTRSGNMYEVDTLNISVNFLGRLSGQSLTVDKDVTTAEAIFPTCAALSITHIIIGMSDGSINWYPISSIADGLFVPEQTSSIKGSVCCFEIDPTFSLLLAGSARGLVNKYPLELLKKEEANDDINNISVDMSTSEDARPPKEVVVVTGERVIFCQSGAVICSTPVSVPIVGTSSVKTGKKTSNLLQVFVTGSHLGHVTFWKQPSYECDAITIPPSNTPPAGIRRSIPRNLNIVNATTLGDNSVACIITVLPSFMKDGSILLGVGTSTGYLDILKLDAVETEDDEEEGGGEEEVAGDEDGIKLVVHQYSRQKIFLSSLSLISPCSDWDMKGAARCIAVGSLFDSRVHILKSDQKNMYNVLMYVSLDGSVSPTSLSWSGKDLFIASLSGIVFSCSYQQISAPPESTQTVRHIMPGAFTSTSYGSIIGGRFISFIHHLLLIPLEGTSLSCVNESNLRTESSPSPQLTNGKGESSFVFGGGTHSDVVVCCCCSPNDKFLATGCADGSVYLWAVQPQPSALESPFYLANKLSVHNDSVISLSFSSDSSFLFSCGSDGSLFIVTVDKATHLQYEFDSSRVAAAKGRKFAESSHFNTAENQTVAQTIWFVEEQEAIIKKLKADYNEKAGEMRTVVSDIETRLHELLDENNARADIERLERSEFVIDVARRDSMKEASIALANKIQETYRLKKYWNELRAARVRELCWDNMEQHSRSILTFAEDQSKTVSSFPVHSLSIDEHSMLDKIKRLRALEIRSQRSQAYGVIQKLPSGKFRVSWLTSLRGLSPSVSWIFGDGALWPSDDIDALANRANDNDAATNTKDRAEKDIDGGTGEAVAHEDDDDASMTGATTIELDESDIFCLLYSPQSLRTDVQKRNHIVLLKETIRVLKKQFNIRFEKLAHEKEDVIASVESRNTRILAIMDELSYFEDVHKPLLVDIEVAESAVTIGDNELLSRPYETEAARAKRLVEEAEALRREANDEKREALDRALLEMMNGTLEVKRSVLADTSASSRPAWFDEISPVDMTDSQLREYEAYDAKIKALQEEQAKYRKQLEQEMKKLKVENADLCKTFDEKVVALWNLKLLVQRQILSLDLFVARTAQNIVRKEQAVSMLKNVEASIMNARKDKAEVSVKVESLSAFCADLKGQLTTAQEEGRMMDKGFKRDIQTLCGTTFDHDTLKSLTDMFRIKKLPRIAEEDEEDDDDEGYDTDGQSESADNSKRGSRRSQRPGGSVGSRSRSKSKRSSQHKRSTREGSKAQGGKIGKRSGRVSAGGGGGGSRKVGSKKFGGGSLRLGPMQQAALALKNLTDEPSYFEKDPFFLPILKKEKEERSAEVVIPLLTPLAMDVDCPDGFNVDQFTFSKLQELRMARVEKEVKEKTLTIKYNAVKMKLDALQKEEQILSNGILALKTSKQEIMETLKNLESDLELLVLLRQGQDEIESDAIVTDYDDAILTSSAVLAKFNSRIKELGKEKIGVLSKMKLFRRKINLVDWEAKHLTLESTYFEEYLRDLQLFRVTRGLQEVLQAADGIESTGSRHKDRVDKANERKEFINRDADARLLRMEKMKETLSKQLTDRTKEISLLERKIRELRVQVSERASVQQSREDSRKIKGNNGEDNDTVDVAVSKMKKVVARKQLVDTAKAQAEEIDALRQELDRVRQKTFPSFIRAVKKRLAKPQK